MKIEISDTTLNEIFLDFVEALIAGEMRRIFSDDTQHSHPEDVEYYKRLRDAARIVHMHYADPE